MSDVLPEADLVVLEVDIRDVWQEVKVRCSSSSRMEGFLVLSLFHLKNRGKGKEGKEHWIVSIGTFSVISRKDSI